MHRREHKTLELRERANERASERTACWFRFIVAYRCVIFSFSLRRRSGDTAMMLLSVNRGPDPRALSPFLKRRGITQARKSRLAAMRPRYRKHAPTARATTGVVIRADLVEGYGFTDLPLLARGTYNGRRGAAPSPFSLAAYIILPIERHTSFPLYVSIYNGPEKHLQLAPRKGMKRSGAAGYASAPRGLTGWCQRG